MNTYILPDYKIKTTKNYYRIKIELKNPIKFIHIFHYQKEHFCRQRENTVYLL